MIFSKPIEKNDNCGIQWVGMRNIKSALSVLIMFLVWQAVRLYFTELDMHPLYGYLTVLLAMRDTVDNSLNYGKMRIKTTFIGLAIGLAFIAINIRLQEIASSEYMGNIYELILIVVGTSVSLHAAYLLKSKNLCAIAGAVFLVSIVRRDSDSRYLYAVLRVFQTIIGLGVSLVINKYVFPYKKQKEQNEDKKYLLGVDVGTTSIKAAVFDEDGNQVSSANVDYTLITKDDFIEFDPKQYWALFQKAVKEAAGDLPVAALSVDTQCETFILADENGNPLCNAVVWLDNRATIQAKKIENQFGAQKIYEITGQPEVTATWPACKLLWFKENKPEIWAKTKKIFLLEDYLLYKMTGEFVTEKTLQSSGLYFDIRKGDWWDEMLDFIGISKDMLPEIKNSGEHIGFFGKAAVVTGAIDQIAASIGAGIIRKGVISEMTGTTMVIFVTSDEIPQYDPNSKIPCHYNFDGKYCLVLWTTTAGMALKWFKNNFCESFDFKQLDALAEAVPAGSGGLTMLPHLSGSQMPKYNPNAKGAFHGITLEHTRGHFTRSIMESVACMLKENLDYLDRNITEIRSMGGGANSDLWCRIKADLTGKKLVTLKHKETACLGSAILAGVGIGVFNSAEQACDRIVKTDKEYMPSGVDYSKIYKKYISLDGLLNKEEK